jgi:hypothetical protein
MILAPLAVAALVVSVATGPVFEPDNPSINLSMRQKNAVMQPLVRSTTECIARMVIAHPHFKESMDAGEIKDLIVDTIRPCLRNVHAMIDAYDQYFGEGTGDAFFEGPYLQMLPSIVTNQVRALLQ